MASSKILLLVFGVICAVNCTDPDLQYLLQHQISKITEMAAKDNPTIANQIDQLNSITSNWVHKRQNFVNQKIDEHEKQMDVMRQQYLGTPFADCLEFHLQEVEPARTEIGKLFDHFYKTVHDDVQELKGNVMNSIGGFAIDQDVADTVRSCVSKFSTLDQTQNRLNCFIELAEGFTIEQQKAGETVIRTVNNLQQFSVELARNADQMYANLYTQGIAIYDKLIIDGFRCINPLKN